MGVFIQLWAFDRASWSQGCYRPPASPKLGLQECAITFGRVVGSASHYVVLAGWELALSVNQTGLKAELRGHPASVSLELMVVSVFFC